jgi:hypothetical protein
MNVYIDHKALTYDLIQSSSLASLMKDLFHGLRDEGNIHLRINDWINISLSTKDAEDQPLIPIRPYQTLLILDSIDLLRTLPKVRGSLKLSFLVITPLMLFLGRVANSQEIGRNCQAHKVVQRVAE